MKSLDKRIFNLEKSFNIFDPYESLSDEELEEEIERMTLDMGYRQGKEGEIPEVELNEKEFIDQGAAPGFVDLTREGLDKYMRLGGYLPDENRREENYQCP